MLKEILVTVLNEKFNQSHNAMEISAATSFRASMQTVVAFGRQCRFSTAIAIHIRAPISAIDSCLMIDRVQQC